MFRMTLALALAIQAFSAPVAQQSSFGLSLGPQIGSGVSSSFGGDESGSASSMPSFDQVPGQFGSSAIGGGFVGASNGGDIDLSNIPQSSGGFSGLSQSGGVTNLPTQSNGVGGTGFALENSETQTVSTSSSSTTTAAAAVVPTSNSTTNATQSGLNAAVEGGWLPEGSNSTSTSASNSTLPANGTTSATQSGLDAAVAGGWLPAGSNTTSTGNITTNATQSGLDAAVAGGWLPRGSNETGNSTTSKSLGRHKRSVQLF